MYKAIAKISGGISLAALMFGLAGGGEAMAQTADAAAPAAATADAEPGLGDIIVTARKLNENLQDTPVTVTALTSESIDRLQVKDLFNLATVTPGLYFGTSGGRNGGNKLQLRNFSTGTGGGSKASVFVDGIYISGDYASTPLANLERIEVLKGPQSVAYGRSTFVGAVNFITKDPGNDFGGRIEALAATQGEYDVSGYVAIPIVTDRLSTQIAFRGYGFRGPDSWTNRDGYHLGNQSTRAISSKTVWSPTDTLKLKFYASYIKDDDHLPPTYYADPAKRNAVIARPGGTFGYYYSGKVDTDFGTPGFNLDVVGYMDNPGIQREQQRYSVFYEWEVAGHTVSGYASHLHEEMDEEFDGTYFGHGTIVAPNAFNRPVTYSYSSFNSVLSQTTRDWQGEIRINSPQNQPFRYVLGGNYLKISGDTLFLFKQVAANGTRFPTTIGVNNNQWSGSFYNPAETKSAFGGLYWDVSDRISLTAEGRYQEDTIDLNNKLTRIYKEATFKAFLPRLNAQYKFSDDVQIYGVYSQGNNPGGFNAVPEAFLPAGTSAAYDEEKMINYEIGLKSKWFGGRLIFNVAAFHMDWKNQQVLQSYVTNRTFQGQVEGVTSSDASSYVNGFEAELEALLTRDLRIRSTVAYGKAKYKSFCSSSYSNLIGVQDRLGCAFVNGRQQEGTPALQTSLSVDYSKPISDTTSIFVRGDWTYQSKVYLEEWDASWIPPINIFNARIGIEHGDATFEIFGRNLSDNDVGQRTTRVTDGRINNATVAGYPAINGVAQGAAGAQNFASTKKKPRQFGVRVAYKF